MSEVPVGNVCCQGLASPPPVVPAGSGGGSELSVTHHHVDIRCKQVEARNRRTQ